MKLRETVNRGEKAYRCSSRPAKQGTRLQSGFFSHSLSRLRPLNVAWASVAGRLGHSLASVDLEDADAGDELAAGTRGGGAFAISDPPVPEVTDVSQSDPAQAPSTVSNLPPTQLARPNCSLRCEESDRCQTSSW